jgi:hypothetical protein
MLLAASDVLMDGPKVMCDAKSNVPLVNHVAVVIVPIPQHM